MATARKKPPAQAPSPKPPAPASGESVPWPLRALDAVYRFLASLKLAVILLTTLAAVLAYATFYERWYGTPAVQADIYQGRFFALLLALLGVNILCAATIRFPWKRRQTGFVVTHAGLLIVLAGAFYSIQSTDEGTLALREGTTSETVVRTDAPIFRVQRLDPKTGEPGTTHVLPAEFGAQPWESEQQALKAADPKQRLGHNAYRLGLLLIALLLVAGVVWQAAIRPEAVGRPLGASLATIAVLGAGLLGYRGATDDVEPRRELLTQPGDPFQIVVKDFLPSASDPRVEYEPGEGGVPMLRLAVLAKPPRAEKETDAFDGRGWLRAPDGNLAHAAIDQPGVPARVDFQYLEGPRADAILAAFLDPPARPLEQRRARIHYVDTDGRPRHYDWLIEDDQATELAGPVEVKAGKSVRLPESDLTATFVNVIPMQTRNTAMLEGLGREFIDLVGRMGRALDSPIVFAAFFKVRRGDGPEVPIVGWGNLPTAPARMPSGHGEPAGSDLAWIDYFHPPRIDPNAGLMSGGKLGVVQVAAMADGRMFYRAFGREGLRGEPGPIRTGEPVPIFGGEGLPMQISARVDEFHRSGVPKIVVDPLPLEPNEMARATPAALVEMTVGDETREFWLPRTKGYDPRFRDAGFSGGGWRISYDFERAKLPFQVTLVDFNPTNDPGSTARSGYRSDVYASPPGREAPAPRPFAELPVGQHFTFAEDPRETFLKQSADRAVSFDGGPAVRVDDPGARVQPIPEPTKIWMNNPMVREGWTFYQSEFQPVFDEDQRTTGEYISILTARYDPAWPVIYLGSLLVVIGTFLQFTMRAGVFSDAGRAAAAAALPDSARVEFSQALSEPELVRKLAREARKSKKGGGDAPAPGGPAPAPPRTADDLDYEL